MSENQKEFILCLRFKKQVWDYLDGRVDGFSTHLKECPRCRNTLEKAEKLLNLLKEGAAPVPQVAYRDSFWPRLKEKITAQDGRLHSFSILKLNPIYYAAMTAAAASLVLWVSIRTPDSPLLTASASGSPDYIMTPAGSPVKTDSPAVNYISGPCASPCGQEADKIDYILPGTITGGSNSWAV